MLIVFKTTNLIYIPLCFILPWRYLKFIELPLSQRKFCQRCQQLLLPDDWEKHGEHQVVGDVSLTQLKRPSRLLYPLENKKTNAQYLFADRSCQFLVDLLSTLGFRRVLCVGTPRYVTWLFKNFSYHHYVNCKKNLSRSYLLCAEYSMKLWVYKGSIKYGPSLKELAIYITFERNLYRFLIYDRRFFLIWFLNCLWF